MNTKRKILPFIIVFLISGLTKAQSSAQATMNVSVRVVSGVSATCTTTQVGYVNGLYDGAFGSLSVKGTEESDLLITTNNRVELINKKGHKISVSVNHEMEHVEDTRQYNFAIVDDGKQGESPSDGVYHGTLNATIEYL